MACTGLGPNLVGPFRKWVRLEHGRTVTADENYIRESILAPGAESGLRIQANHASFQGLANEEQLNALVAYVKSLNHNPSAAADGPAIVQTGTKPQEPKVQ